jgi:hypothetical protein
VQIVIHGAVEPGEPDHAEDHRKLADTPPCQVLGQVMRRPSDDNDIHEVIEQLDEADRPVLDDIAVGTWRKPEPLPEGSKHGLEPYIPPIR